LGGAVDLRVEGRELSHYQGIAQAFQEGLDDRSRVAGGIDQPGLQLEASDLGSGVASIRPSRSQEAKRSVSVRRRRRNSAKSSSLKRELAISWPIAISVAPHG
jgi:hypothetical protein